MGNIRVFIKFLLPAMIYWPNWCLCKMGMHLYELYHGYRFDLAHPRTFTEKIQRYMWKYDGRIISKITDKISFKDYIKDQLGAGYTVPMYNSWTNVKDFERDWDILPQKFVLKSSIQGDGYCMRIILDKSVVDFEELKKEVSTWFSPKKTLLNNVCCRFFNSKPRVLAEQYVEYFGGKGFEDYKFFCFDGEPYCLYFDGHFNGQHAMTFLDLKWNKLDVQYGSYPNDYMPAKPKFFEDMVQISRQLSKNFPFVRVDFFETSEHLFLSEMTFNPGGGLTKYHPESFNEELGRLLHLPD